MNAAGAARVGFAGSSFRSESSGLARGKAIGGDDVSWSSYSVDGLGRHRCTRDSFAKLTSLCRQGVCLKAYLEQGRVCGDRTATLVPNWDDARRGCRP